MSSKPEPWCPHGINRRECPPCLRAALETAERRLARVDRYATSLHYAAPTSVVPGEINAASERDRRKGAGDGEADARHIATHADPETTLEMLALLAILDRVRGTDTDMVEGKFSRSEIGLRIDAVRDQMNHGEKTNA